MRTAPDFAEREERHTALAREAAARRITVLANPSTSAGNVLPLASSGRVALFGPGARHTSAFGAGSGDVQGRPVASIDAGLRAAGLTITSDAWLDRMDAHSAAEHRAWSDRMDAAVGDLAPEKMMDAVWVALADRPKPSTDLPIEASEVEACADATIIYVLTRQSGEGHDRTETPGDYLLSDVETANLRALAATGRPLVLLLNCGGPVDLSILDEIEAAVVFVGHPGVAAGHAVADVLTGAVNPSGRLGSSWTRRLEDHLSTPVFSSRGDARVQPYVEGLLMGYRGVDARGIEPRFAFGHGLSYTTFEVHTEDPAQDDGDAMVRVGVHVTNTGERPGGTVVQVYAASPHEGADVRRLVAFARTPDIDPGSTEEIALAFPLERLSWFRESDGVFVVAAGEHVLEVGESSRSTEPVAVVDVAEEYVVPTADRRGLRGHLSELTRPSPSATWPSSSWVAEPPRHGIGSCPVLLVRRRRRSSSRTASRTCSCPTGRPGSTSSPSWCGCRMAP